MKKKWIVLLITLLFCLINSNFINAQGYSNMTILYPVEASATKYGQTIKMPDLSGLPLFSATYERNTNKVIVRKGDRKLTLTRYGNGKYYKSGQYERLTYSMDASVYNGMVSRLIYTETEDNITVTIIYTIK